MSLHREGRETRTDRDRADVVEVHSRDALEDGVCSGEGGPFVVTCKQQRELVAAKAERLAALGAVPPPAKARGRPTGARTGR